MATSPSRRSSGLIGATQTASTDDDAGKLTTTYQPIVGLQSAKTAQINCVATFSTQSDEVIIQVTKNGVNKNITLTWDDFRPSTLAPNQFVAGTYRAISYTRGYGISQTRIGLSSTATDIRADFSAVC